LKKGLKRHLKTKRKEREKTAGPSTKGEGEAFNRPAGKKRGNQTRVNEKKEVNRPSNTRGVVFGKREVIREKMPSKQKQIEDNRGDRELSTSSTQKSQDVTKKPLTKKRRKTPISRKEEH